MISIAIPVAEATAWIVGQMVFKDSAALVAAINGAFGMAFHVILIAVVVLLYVGLVYWVVATPYQLAFFTMAAVWWAYIYEPADGHYELLWQIAAIAALTLVPTCVGVLRLRKRGADRHGAPD